jgi:hypothetical protein
MLQHIVIIKGGFKQNLKYCIKLIPLAPFSYKEKGETIHEKYYNFKNLLRLSFQERGPGGEFKN